MIYKVLINGYIEGLCESTTPLNHLTEITQAEADEIKSRISTRPYAEGKGYRLKADLTWEEYDLPVIDEGEEEVTSEEIAQAIAEVLG